MMRLAAPSIDRTCTEREVYDAVLALDGKRILELGCGRAEHTRAIATSGAGRTITALEVDARQHRKNLAIADLPNVRFVLAGAEAIPEPDASFDCVLMFKSLHHVPAALMPRGLEEIARVLKPGGLAYLSEPLFAGDFNELIRQFHDEQAVRAAAFAAICAAVTAGHFELVEQIFFQAPVVFRDFAEFEDRLLCVTHTAHRLEPALYAAIREQFHRHLTATGAHFTAPTRVDLLRKPALPV